MHALMKKNENAERYSQNSCQDIQRKLQHLIDPWPSRDAYSQVCTRTRKRLNGCSLKTQKFGLSIQEKKEERKRERQIHRSFVLLCPVDCVCGRVEFQPIHDSRQSMNELDSKYGGDLIELFRGSGDEKDEHATVILLSKLRGCEHLDQEIEARNAVENTKRLRSNF
jgi:hypothetical protein